MSLIDNRSGKCLKDIVQSVAAGTDLARMAIHVQQELKVFKIPTVRRSAG